MTRFFRMYLPFSFASLKSEFLTYRLNSLIWLGYEILSFAVIYFLWDAIYSSSDVSVINGLTFPFVIYYYLASKLVFYFSDIEFGQTIAQDVRKGTLAIHLIKPINYRTQLLFTGLGRSIGYVMFFGILPVIGMVVLNNTTDIGIKLDAIRVVVFFTTCVLSLSIAYCLKLFTGALRLVTVNGFGVFNFERAIFGLFSGTLIPIVFLPGTIKNIFEVLPFQYTVYAPTSVLIGLENDYLRIIGIQLMWFSVLYITSKWVWNRTMAKAVILGG